MIMETLREKVRNLPRSSRTTSFIGEVGLVDESGEISRTWQPSQAAITIGTDADNEVQLREGNVAGIHAQIVFGKNRTLIRSMEGQVRVNGRSIRETLIDQPTSIQCGSARLFIVPARFVGEGRFGGHRVSSGSVVDQATRLRSQPRTPSKQPGFESIEGRLVTPFFSETTADSNPSVPTGSTDVSQKLETPSVADLTQFLAALAPIQNAIAETQQGIVSLQERISAAEAREPSLLPQALIPDVSEVMSRIDERIGTFTTQCELLLSNAATNFDERFQQIGELVQRLAEEREPSTAANESLDYDAMTFGAAESNATQLEVANHKPPSPSDSPTYPTAYATPFEEDLTFLPEQETYPVRPEVAPSAYTDSPIEDTAEEQFQETVSEAAPELPSWFTSDKDESSENYSLEAIAEPDFVSAQESVAEAGTPDDSAWMSARLNPIYAEDTSDWLKEVDAAQYVEDALDKPEQEVYSYAASTATPVDQPNDRSLDQPHDQPEIIDYNDYAGMSFASEASPSVTEADYAAEMPDSPYAPAEESIENEPIPEPFSSASSSRYEPSANNESSTDVSSNAGQVESTDEAEESIEDYMQRLLQRVKGEGGDSPTAKPSVKTSTSAASATVSIKSNSIPISPPSHANPTTKNYAEAVTMLPQQTEDSADQEPNFAPRKSAPERSENMAALRELANSTARSAIQKSSKKRMELGIATKFGISMLGLAGGLVLLFLNGFNANIAMLGMICSFIVCLLWGYEASTEAKKLASSNVKQPTTGNQST